MNKYFLWGTCLAFAVTHIVLSFAAANEYDKNHYLDRAASYTAASFVILAIPNN